MEKAGRWDGEGEPDFEDHDPLTHAVIGAGIAVHRALGPGLSEEIYEKALCVELTKRAIPFVCQHLVRVEYSGVEVGEFKVDLIVDGCLVVELKAVESLAPVHTAQVIAYLKCARLQRGLLINFNVNTLKSGIKRISL